MAENLTLVMMVDGKKTAVGRVLVEGDDLKVVKAALHPSYSDQLDELREAMSLYHLEVSSG